MIAPQPLTPNPKPLTPNPYFAMPDNKRKKKLDRRRISLSDPAEAADWCRTLGVSKSQLRQVVQLVGDSAAKVRACLRLCGHKKIRRYRRR